MASSALTTSMIDARTRTSSDYSPRGHVHRVRRRVAIEHVHATGVGRARSQPSPCCQFVGW